MKRLLCFALAVVLCLTFSACTEGSNSQGVAGGNEQLNEDILANLNAAVEKLMESDSFEVITTDKSVGAADAVVTYQLATIDGQTHIRVDGNAVSGSRNFDFSSYYMGNQRFTGDLFSSWPTVTKTIYEDGITLPEVIQSELDVTAFLETFAALQPTTKVKDGMTQYTKSISKEAFLQLYACIYGEDAYIELFPVGFYSVSVEVDSQGVLRQVTLKGPFESRTLTVNRINEITSLEMPESVRDFEYDFTYTLRTSLVVEKGEQRVIYRPNGWQDYPSFVTGGGDWNNVDFGFGFAGFESYYKDDYIVEVAEVPEEIDGIPVVRVCGVIDSGFGDVKVKRLVIPKGVQINIGATYEGDEILFYTENTTLFFCDTEENVVKMFSTPDTPSVEFEGEELPMFQAAYYAGQWEYVDGIPTPLN